MAQQCAQVFWIARDDEHFIEGRQTVSDRSDDCVHPGRFEPFAQSPLAQKSGGEAEAPVDHDIADHFEESSNLIVVPCMTAEDALGKHRCWGHDVVHPLSQ